MAKGVRRTPEQLLKDALAKVAELEAKIKAKNELNADNKLIKAIVADIGKAAKELGVSEKEILKLVTSKVAPRQPRAKKS